MALTAAFLIIGNELLTGKIQESNLQVLAKQLFRWGIELHRVVMCRDTEQDIASELSTLDGNYDWVFTSGGVGPTHDDVTIAAVAQHFAREIARSPELERRIRAHHGDAVTEVHLRMADIPEGSTLVHGDDQMWPTLRVENVFVMPGVPQAFRKKLELLRETLDTGEAFATNEVFTQCNESLLAPLLNRLTQAYPQVDIGSYPVWGDPSYETKITFDGKSKSVVSRAMEAFVAALDPKDIVHKRENRS
ncbi:MAG: competence/damage-inducible protein A [Myxococcota bacterium]